MNTTLDIKEFYDANYRPLTPYVQALAKKMSFFTDSNKLNNEYKLIDRTMSVLRRHPRVIDKVEFHLKNIPMLGPLSAATLDTTELFLIKKFLVNYFAVVKELTANKLAGDFELSFSSKELLQALCVDQDATDSFYLNDSYSDELKDVRKQIRQVDAEIEKIKQGCLLDLLKKFKLDFKLRDFLVINENVAITLDKKYFFIEPYDSKNFIVKPIYSDKYFALYLKRDLLISQEQAQEKVILDNLSKQVLSQKKQFAGYIDAITGLDVLLAKSRLALQYNMTKPVIRPIGSSIKLKNGKYIPLANTCKLLGTKYYPLTSEFKNNIAVITGSNMGGKTVLLQTICFMQALAQMGFFVPADLYETVIFKNIHYLGETKKQDVNGLSSFGLEIHEFMTAYNDSKGPTLFMIDEFARATNSVEAIALLSAILKTCSENSELYMFLSTHFIELPKFNKVSFYKMKGLDYAGYEKYYNKERDYSLEERIRLINKYMKYEVVAEDVAAKQCDALNVASILGLDKKILSYAKGYLAAAGKNKK